MFRLRLKGDDTPSDDELSRQKQMIKVILGKKPITTVEKKQPLSYLQIL